MLAQNTAIIDGAITVAREAKAGAIMLAARLAGEQAYLEAHVDAGIRVVIGRGASAGSDDGRDDEVLVLPQIHLRRRGRAKVALLEALAAGTLHPGESVVIISGRHVDGVMHLDTIALVQLEEAATQLDGEADAPLGLLRDVADPAVFDALLTLCVELGHEGKEGKPVGLIATLGDADAVLERSHPLVMNPFHGHDASERSILVPAARRAIREFSGVDGAFVITRDGVVLAGGRYLQDTGDVEVPTGLGARHRAAAGITAATSAISFCVSETSGDTRVFGGGRLIMTIDRTD